MVWVPACSGTVTSSGRPVAVLGGGDDTEGAEGVERAGRVEGEVSALSCLAGSESGVRSSSRYAFRCVPAVEFLGALFLAAGVKQGWGITVGVETDKPKEHDKKRKVT